MTSLPDFAVESMARTLSEAAGEGEDLAKTNSCLTQSYLDQGGTTALLRA